MCRVEPMNCDAERMQDHERQQQEMNSRVRVSSRNDLRHGLVLSRGRMKESMQTTCVFVVVGFKLIRQVGRRFELAVFKSEGVVGRTPLWWCHEFKAAMICIEIRGQIGMSISRRRNSCHAGDVWTYSMVKISVGR
jgi:hypothetical protein